MHLVLDLETIGTEDPRVIDRIAANIKPPGNLKKQETIEKWIAEEKQSCIEEAVRKTSFDGTYGKIVCIGFAIDDQEARAECGMGERALLSNFFDFLDDVTHGGHKPVTAIGHNIVGFDLKFLWKRCVINGIKPPRSIPFKAKPWDSSVFDTMLEWDADKERRVSLDNLCAALGIESPKTGMDGSMVWEAYKAGQFAEIAAYCKADVNAVRQAHRRMTFA